MKKNILIILLSISLTISLSSYFDAKEALTDSKSEIDELKIQLAQLESIPSLNTETSEFLLALNRSEHKPYLTGKALDEYNEYVEMEEHADHKHEEVDFSTQDVNILMVSSDLTDDEKLQSTALYQLVYEGMFDDPASGVVDRRILSIVMDIDWVVVEGQPLVNDYRVHLLQENMGETLSGLNGSGGSE